MILPNSAGWNVSGPDADPQPRPVDLRADTRHDGEQQQHQSCQPDRVRVGVELPVVADKQQRQDEADHPSSSHTACSSAMRRLRHRRP